MITYNVDGVKMPKIKKRDTSAWIRKVAASHGRKVGEIGYMFVYLFLRERNVVEIHLFMLMSVFGSMSLCSGVV